MHSLAGAPGASQFALMSLLREGGQWEGEEDILRDVHGPEPNSPLSPMMGPLTGRGDMDVERAERRARRASTAMMGDNARLRKGSQGNGSKQMDREEAWLERPELPTAVSLASNLSSCAQTRKQADGSVAQLYLADCASCRAASAAGACGDQGHGRVAGTSGSLV